jgi:hypothetical protein
MDAITPTKQIDDAALVSQVVVALKAYECAEAVKKEKAVILGGLLAEAQKRHPTEKAFEAFLRLAGGIQIRRAQDLIAFALKRKDFDKHQQENAAAQQRHRDKLKAEKIEREKAKAALAGKPKPDDALRNARSEPKPDASHDAQPKPKPDASRNASKRSADALREFEYACRTYLPQLSESDLKKAGQFIALDSWRSKQGKAA